MIITINIIADKNSYNSIIKQILLKNPKIANYCISQQKSQEALSYSLALQFCSLCLYFSEQK